MAAPMESDSSNDSSEATDPLSDSFDPYKALYSPSVKLPIPDAKQFNNLAEFENFLYKKDAKSRLKKRKEELPGIIAHRAAMQAREATRKAAIMSKSTGPPVEKSITQQRKQRSTNVLSNMERFDKGPMSILRRCVNERLRVVVVVRAAVSVRSHCRGYIIAFDKHMNMALMDVDEKYIKPVVMKKEDKEKVEANKDQMDIKTEVKDTSKSAKYDEHDETPIPSGSSTVVDLRTKLQGFPRNRELRQSFEKCVLSDSEVKKRDRLKRFEKETAAQSDSEVLNKQGKTLDKIQAAKKYKKTKQFVPFWPLYKKWTESRCYSSYEIVDRHINQIFIRGDNVVSVSIAQ